MKVDLSEVERLLRAALKRCEDLHGMTVPEPAVGKDRTRALAAFQRDVLYLAHLCDAARVGSLGVYHKERGGYADHLVTHEQDALSA